MSESKTRVIFRLWPKVLSGGVIAIFPQIPGTHNKVTCMSYEHVGQHGVCVPEGLIKITKPAKGAMVKELKVELEKIGYRLQVVRKLSNADYRARSDEIDRQKESARQAGQ